MAPNDPPAIANARAKTDMDANGVVNATDFHQFIDLAFQVMNYDLTQGAPTVPAAPTSLLVSVAGTLVTLNWTDNSNNELGFTVERQGSTTFLGSNANITTVTDQPGPGTWNYRVRSFNNTGTSAWTPFVPITVASTPTVPAAPSGFNISLSGTIVNLTWTDNSNNETSFQIEKNGSTNYISVATNATSYSESPGVGTWSYRIRSTNATGSSAWVGPVSVTVQNTNPSVGWTDVSLPSGALAFYVSSSGNDSNPGTQASPVRTIAAGYAKLRDGQPDQLLLKCGESFPMTSTLSLTKGSGFTNNKYMVIGSYGSGSRPLVTCSANTFFNGESNNKRGLAFVGIEFVGDRRTDGLAIRLLGWRDVLLEDCCFHDMHRALVFQGYNIRSSGLKVRRNVGYDITSSDCIGTNCPQFSYVDLTDDWLYEENFFDKCGNVGSMYSRPVYLQDNCGQGTFKGNVMSRSPAEGVQVRAGGIVTDNLSIRNPIGMYVGNNGVTNEISNNVIIESGDIGPGSERGRGIHFNGPSNVSKNIVAYNTGKGWGSVHGFYCQSASGSLNDNYVYEWTRSPTDGGPGDPLEAQSILVDGGSWQMNRNRVYSARQGIVMQSSGTISGSGNTYYEPAGNYPPFRPNATFSGWTAEASLPIDPNFRAMLPGGSIDAYCNLIRSQSKQNWNDALLAKNVNAAMRAKVGL